MSSNLTTLAHIFKRKYSDAQVAEVAGREHPTWMMITKKGGFSGELMSYSIDYSFPQGVGGTLVGAQAAVSGTAGKALLVYRRAKFGVIRLNNEAIAACTSDGALYDMATKETDRILKELGDGFGFDLFGNGSGVRGQIATGGITGDVITLTDANDVRNFKINMRIGAATGSNGTTGARSGTTTVTAIDEGAGKITVDAVADITALAAADYLFRATEPGTCMEGMETATPLTAPTSGDSFRGIDRSIDVQGLSGVRVTGTGNIVADFGSLAVKAHLRSKKLKKGVLNPTNFWNVSQLLNAKVEYDGGGGTAEVGFEYITINTPGGAMRIYSDPDCPANRGRAFDPAAHYVYHLNGVPHLDRRGNGGDVEMRMSTEDAVEVRARGWLNYCQGDTAAHGVISI